MLEQQSVKLYRLHFRKVIEFNRDLGAGLMFRQYPVEFALVQCDDGVPSVIGQYRGHSAQIFNFAVHICQYFRGRGLFYRSRRDP
ncbi:hypothetical protein D3C81_2100720 [compost metagenome]